MTTARNSARSCSVDYGPTRRSGTGLADAHRLATAVLSGSPTGPSPRFLRAAGRQEVRPWCSSSPPSKPWSSARYTTPTSTEGRASSRSRTGSTRTACRHLRRCVDAGRRRGERDDLGDPPESGLHRPHRVREGALLRNRQEEGQGATRGGGIVSSSKAPSPRSYRANSGTPPRPGTARASSALGVPGIGRTC